MAPMGIGKKMNIISGGIPVLIQSKNADISGTSGIISYTSSVTQGNLLVVQADGFNSSPMTITDNLSNVYNLVNYTGTGSAFVGLWWCLSKASGACTVTVTGSNDDATLWEFSGFSSNTGVDAQNSQTTGQSNVPVTTQHSNCAVIAGYCLSQGAAAGNSGWTNYSPSADGNVYQAIIVGPPQTVISGTVDPTNVLGCCVAVSFHT